MKTMQDITRKTAKIALAVLVVSSLIYYFKKEVIPKNVLVAIEAYLPSQQTLELNEVYDIRPMDIARDTEFIKKQNVQNWYLLHNTPVYDIDFMLQKNAPYVHEPRYYGKLSTVVLFDNNNPVGFVNYYMRGIHEGTVFLLAVDEAARGKGFGEILLRYAVSELKKQGAHFAKLSVRKENERAQKLYKKVGFAIETSQDDFDFYRLNLL